MSNRTYAPRGFTLLELVTVLVVMSLLAAFAVVGLGNDDKDLSKEATVLRMHLRYAQTLAMGKGKPYGVRGGGSSYFLFKGSATGTRIAFPAQSSGTYSLPSGLSVSSFLVSFDEWGVPYRDATQSAALSSDMDLTMTAATGSGTASEGITITPVTGFVP